MNLIRQKITVIFLLNLLGITFLYSGQKNYGDAVVSEVIRVYDGDTFTVDLKDYPDIIGKSIGIRIAGIDTPEIRSKTSRLKEKAYAARDFLRELLNKAEKIVLKNMRRGKYFRIVADVILNGNVNVAQELINKKLARPYDGKTGKPWVDSKKK